MPDQVEKMLRKLSPRQHAKLAEIIRRIVLGNLLDLDVKKLKGREDIFRVRQGDFRIIFRKMGGFSQILTIERRTDTTYR